MQNTIAIILITAGTIGAALGVAQTDTQVQGWEGKIQINYWLTGISLCSMIIGILLKRLVTKTSALTSLTQEGNKKIIHDAINNLSDRIKQIEQNLSTYNLDTLHEQLEESISGPLSDFVDNRQYLADTFGISGYAAVMTPFAQGERYLNRAWSASADGYLDEAIHFLRQSVSPIQETQHILQQQESKTNQS